MREEFGAKNPKSLMLRFHTQTAGVQLTAQQPEVNLVRVAVQGLAAVLGGTQSLHTNSFDEAIALPTDKSARLALRTQQVLAYETDVTATVDPFAGSYVVESMTDEVESGRGRADAPGRGPGRRGGRHRAGLPEERDRAQSAYRIAQETDAGERVVVGVNRFQLDEEEPLRAAAGRPGDRGPAGGPAGGAARGARPGGGGRQRWPLCRRRRRARLAPPMSSTR